MPEVVHRKRYVHSDDIADLRDSFTHQGDPFVRHLHAREHVNGAIALPQCGRARRCGQRSRNAAQHINADVHLEPREPIGNPLSKRSANTCGRALAAICIDPHRIAELAAEHRIHRRVVGLAGKVPQCHLDAANTAGLARMKSELPDLAEHLVTFQGFSPIKRRFNMSA